ncbi:OsmC family protein [Niveispirillum sp. KHB5.9]|uniref:OsmC family protein n=1 Tax=Niveispirillum sp. KHB5.9 TaxID=3400269 RepID=UPI003A857791
MDRIELASFMDGLRETVSKATPEQCLEPMSGTVTQVRGFQSIARFGDVETLVDEPTVFGGTGTAPNPAEIALAGLGASIQVTMLCYAAHLSIDATDIVVKLAGALDARGFFDMSPDVPVGFYEVTADVTYKGSASEAQVAQLLDYVNRCCPVLAVFRQPMQVKLSMRQVP